MTGSIFPAHTDAFADLGPDYLTLDLHVGGEPIRLLIGGLGPLPGASMNQKREYMAAHHDRLRLLLTREPRGHRDMFAGVITPPSSEEAHFGLLFMDARRYPYMCGHGVIGAVTAALEMGWIVQEEEEPVVKVDTPSGVVHARARIRRLHGRAPKVDSVSIQLESAFVYRIDQRLHVPRWGEFTVDVVFAGGFFIMLPSEQTGHRLTSAAAPSLARLGMALLEAANRQLQVQHPLRAYIRSIDVVEYYEKPLPGTRVDGKSMVVLGEGHIDRSPCGTGTSAKMALLHHRGELQTGALFVNQGPAGTTFEGRIVQQTDIGGYPAIMPEIRGSAFITGLHRFVLSPEDPFPQGFLL